jgi:hypothetical protein
MTTPRRAFGGLGGTTPAGEAGPVPCPWSCRVTWTLDDQPAHVRDLRGPTAADAAALARALAERSAQAGVWTTAYTLLPPHRINVITISDPVHATGPQ